MTKDKDLWNNLEALGEDEVRLRVSKGVYGKSKLPLVNEWLRRREAGTAPAPGREFQAASLTTPEPTLYDRVLRYLSQDICGLLPGLCGTASAPPRSPTGPSSTQRPTHAPDKRVFTTRSPRELLSLYEGRTILQGDRLMEPYKGLWISVQAVTSMIMPATSGITFVLMSGEELVNARFDDRWRTALARVNQGDTVRLIGKIASAQNGQQLYLLDSDLAE